MHCRVHGTSVDDHRITQINVRHWPPESATEGIGRYMGTCDRCQAPVLVPLRLRTVGHMLAALAESMCPPEGFFFCGHTVTYPQAGDVPKQMLLNLQ